MMRLVADIGGTNTRLALSQEGRVLAGSVRSFANDYSESFEALLSAYLAQTDACDPGEVVLAVAGPVQGSKARLTNRNWHFDAQHLSALCGGARVSLLNDLQAMGYAAAWLAPEGRIQLREMRADSAGAAQKLVVGVGTGFNVCPVITHAGLTVCGAAEAGHQSLPAAVSAQLAALGVDAAPFQSVEDLFSGRGFSRFCSLLSGDDSLKGEAAIATYGQPDADASTAAVDAYAIVLGQNIRDLALAYLPTEGIYFAGSVARAILQTAPDPCLKALEAPYAFSEMARFPVYVITDDAAALMGCARAQF